MKKFFPLETVSFDFDGTLVDDNLKPIPKILSILRKTLDSGINCIIVTARRPKYLNDIEVFLKKNKLNGVRIISSTVYDNEGWKSQIFERYKALYNVRKHYDNDYLIVKEIHLYSDVKPIYVTDDPNSFPFENCERIILT